MNKKDLENYEPVKSRKNRFYENHPDGRIIVESLQLDENTAVFKASIFFDKEDQERGLPRATGFAQEFAGKGGFANKTSWCENCEESAVGRALDNGGYFGTPQCSQEEMTKVKGAEKVSAEDRKKLYDFATKTLGYTHNEFVAALQEQGYKSTADILNKEFDALKALLERGKDADEQA